MHKLIHFRLCPLSRSVRIALAELGLETALVEERNWEWRPAFLAVNPSGELPVLEHAEAGVLLGSYAISEYLAEAYPVHPQDGGAVPLFPGEASARAEVRRLVDWCHRKMYREATAELLVEKVYPQFAGGQRTDANPAILRAVRANLRYHIRYIDWLARRRRWLASEALSFADLAAAAHISVADYLGEVPWSEHPAAKDWYARMKSRRAVRAVLADRVPGLPPPRYYDDPDF